MLVYGASVSQAATSGNTKVLTRISGETGVSVETLQTEKETTGLGYGELENANLLANASGQSFDTIMSKRQSGEGWGQIAHDYNLNMGKVVSAAHRSDQATTHAQNTVHGKNGTAFGGRNGSMKGNVGTHSGHVSVRAKGHGGNGKGHGH